MAKKKRSKGRPTRHRRQEKPATSLVIPVFVGVVVVAIIIAVIVSYENQRTDNSVAVLPTAEGLPTREIPHPSVPRMAVGEAHDRQVAGKAMLVDVRSAAAYEQSHIAGAISVPEGELLDRLDDLPQDVDLVLYCV